MPLHRPRCEGRGGVPGKRPHWSPSSLSTARSHPTPQGLVSTWHRDAVVTPRCTLVPSWGWEGRARLGQGSGRER